MIIKENRIPFSITMNAADKGSLYKHAYKWYNYSTERRETWLKNFIPNYKKYLEECTNRGYDIRISWFI